MGREEDEAESPSDDRYRLQRSLDESGAGDRLEVEEEEGREREETMDSGDIQRKDGGADRPDACNDKDGEDPAFPVGAVEEVAAGDV